MSDPDPDLAALIERVTGSAPGRMTSLSGGCIAACYKVDLDGGGAVVVKRSAGGDLETEGWMLRYLAEHSALPAPAVLHAEPSLLVMTHIESGGRLDRDAQRDAARHLAALHAITADRYGLDRDTLIGGLPQPNGPMDDWVDFFRERRLLHMADAASAAGALPAATRGRIDTLAKKLPELLPRTPPASLIHGDMWGGNVLPRDGRIAGFVDPAIYYADAEIELAFSTLFGTFGDAFFDAYCALRPLERDFFATRRDLLNLYPLLVHVRLFGGAYVGQVESVLGRFVG